MDTPLNPPGFAGVAEYGSRLSDAAYWAPYVREALARHGLPDIRLHAATAGTFPTFIVGDYVIKLFGAMFSGAQRFAIERTVHRMMLEHPDMPVPALVADGCLFGDNRPWTYLITKRLDAPVWSNASLLPDLQQRLARRIGAVMRCVHELPAPHGPPWGRNTLADLRAGCVERHRQWRTLPEHLIDQIDRFLIAPSTVQRLVHADLHGDHLFVDHGDVAGIIDWGNAAVTDPYYELPALHLHTFSGDSQLLDQFLAGYGWERPPDFARRAMSMTLLHEFNVLSGVPDYIELASMASLECLADLLWNNRKQDTAYQQRANETPPRHGDVSPG